MGEIELQADQEEQHRHADLGEQVDLAMCLDQAETGWPDQDAHGDIGDEDRLPEAYGHRPHGCSDEQEQGEFAEGCVHAGSVHGAQGDDGLIRGPRQSSQDMLSADGWGCADPPG